MAANWSHLPQDLLIQIAKRLDIHFDLLHLRAVCPSWRASISSNLVPPPSYSLVSNSKKTTLFKRTIFLLKSPQLDNQKTQHFWLLKLGQDKSGKTRILDPLSSKNIPKNVKFPKVLDISRFHVQELAHEYVVVKNTIDGLKFKKVACLNSNSTEDQKYILSEYINYLSLLKFGVRDEEGTRIDVIGWSTIPLYQDVIQCNGKFYAVDDFGRVVVVDHNSRTAVQVAGKLTLRGRRNNFLVESCEKLLLVVMSERNTSSTSLGNNSTFEMFRLDEERRIWERMLSLDDGILFLGKYSNFSVPAIPGVQGNCIVFENETSSAGGSSSAYVFHMENQKIVPLEDSDDYLKLYGPPLRGLKSEIAYSRLQAPATNVKCTVSFRYRWLRCILN